MRLAMPRLHAGVAALDRASRRHARGGARRATSRRWSTTAPGSTASSCGPPENELLLRMWESLHVEIHSRKTLLQPNIDMFAVAESHAPILAAIAAGDVELACRLSREHQAIFRAQGVSQQSHTAAPPMRGRWNERGRRYYHWASGCRNNPERTGFSITAPMFDDFSISGISRSFAIDYLFSLYAVVPLGLPTFLLLRPSDRAAGGCGHRRVCAGHNSRLRRARTLRCGDRSSSDKGHAGGGCSAAGSAVVFWLIWRLSVATRESPTGTNA